SHTGDNVHKKISDVLNKYNINLSETFFVSDSAVNTRKAFEVSKCFPCFAHMLNTQINDVFLNLLDSDPEIKNIWSQIVDIAALLNGSSNKSDLLSK
ncbi:MAG: RNA polymerase II regulatory region DNA binding, partial [Paramarteilia canceri]